MRIRALSLRLSPIILIETEVITIIKYVKYLYVNGFNVQPDMAVGGVYSTYQRKNPKTLGHS
jgi:hypothetical protein